MQPEDCSEWFNKPSLRKCVEQIERSKELKQELMKRKDQLNQLQEANKDAARNLATLREANKSKTHNEDNDKNVIRQKNEYLLKNVSEKEAQMKQC